jgi:hypothetical protein
MGERGSNMISIYKPSEPIKNSVISNGSKSKIYICSMLSCDGPDSDSDDKTVKQKNNV